jgi:hypothetical protein
VQADVIRYRSESTVGETSGEIGSQDRLEHRLQEGAVWKALLQCTLDDDDDDDSRGFVSIIMFNCALYNADILDPCIINSTHFLSVNSKTPTTKTASSGH